LPIHNKNILTASACALFFVIGSTLAASAEAPAKKGLDAERTVPGGLTIDKIMAMQSPGDIQVSPDGKWVAFVLSSNEEEKDKAFTQLWMTSTVAAIQSNPHSPSDVHVYDGGRSQRITRINDKLLEGVTLGKVITPRLVIGGKEDWNVPILNSEQIYQVLKRRGIETQLVVYPGEFHGLRRPSFVRDRYNRFLVWYQRFVRAE